MNKIIPILIISIMTIAGALTASILLKPTQQTPIKKVLLTPDKSNKNPLPKDKTIAAWIWKYPTDLDPEIGPLLQFANEQNVNTIYVYIDQYIDIYETTNSPKKSEKLEEYSRSLVSIITKAKERNITVHALSGNPNYSYDSHEYIPPILVDHIFQFNQDHPETQFAGIQFDLEFYDDSRFFQSTQEYTDNYLKVVDRLADQVLSLNNKTNQNLRLGLAIPFWFDKPNDYFQKPILNNVISSLNKVPNSYLIVMSYRNTINDEGGVMAITKEELEATKDTSVKIIIGQELVDNKDKKITHFGKSREQIKFDLNQLIQSAQVYPSFEGISIHDLEALANTL